MSTDPREYRLIMADSTEMALTKFQGDRELRRGRALNILVVMALQGLGYLPFRAGEPRVKIVEEEAPPPSNPSSVDVDIQFARKEWWQLSAKARSYYHGKYPDALHDLNDSREEAKT
jgi:hypothetical protein